VLDARHQGAGLGLPFAKSVVELHGGTLTIESKLGSGTTVSISLPLPERADAAV
jgi:two-component system, cell cycle sensor histidine kinase PleC